MRHAVLAALLLVCLPAIAASQQKPDFSGTWTLPPDAPLGRNGKPAPAPGFGATVNIQQTADAVTIEKAFGDQTVHVVHPLDGTESRSRQPGRLCMADATSVWTANWEGNDIVTTLVGAFPPGVDTMTRSGVKTVFRLTAPDTMAVDLTFAATGAAAPRTVSTTYKRTGPPSPVPADSAPPVRAKAAQLEWLGGTWSGVNANGTTFEERWTPPTGGSMLAISRTVRNTGVLNAFEFLCIVERNGGLVYQAMPNGRSPATDFTLTQMTATSLTFENPGHDFPKKIVYTLGSDGTLEAVISGTDTQKPLRYRWKKQ